MDDNTVSMQDARQAKAMGKGPIEKSYKLFQLIDSPNSELYKLFKYNTFTHTLEYSRKSPWGCGGVDTGWHDSDSLKMAAYLLKEGIAAPRPAIIEAVEMAAHQNEYDPISDWMNGLRWDGVKRLDTILPDTAGCEDNPYTRAVGRKTIIAAANRIINPGCQHRTVMILEGSQNTGKSTWIRTLAGVGLPGGGEYYAGVRLTARAMEQPQFLLGKWIIEFAELSGLSEARMDAVKSFIAQPQDCFYKRYGRNYETFHRRSIFIGSYNPSNRGYLNDSTGNTRFLPVLTGTINIPLLIENRDQYFAEAMVYIGRKETSEITNSLVVNLATEEQYKREQKHPWHYLIAKHVEWMHEVTLDDIRSELNIEKGRFQQKEADVVADILWQIGFVRDDKGNFHKRTAKHDAEEALKDLHELF